MKVYWLIFAGLLWLAGGGILQHFFAEPGALMWLWTMFSVQALLSLWLGSQLRHLPLQLALLACSLGWLLLLGDWLWQGARTLQGSTTLLSLLNLLTLGFVAVLYQHSHQQLYRQLEQLHANEESLKAQLHQQAYRDALTGLLNRRAFFEHYFAVLRQKPILVYFNLHHFKQANQQYGHHIGDELLKRFANVLVAQLHGAQCFRLAGDEFAVLLTNQQHALPSDITAQLELPLTNYGVSVWMATRQLTDEPDPDQALLALTQQHEKVKYREQSRT